jgi:alkaline phosphatase
VQPHVRAREAPDRSLPYTQDEGCSATKTTNSNINETNMKNTPFLLRSITTVGRIEWGRFTAWALAAAGVWAMGGMAAQAQDQGNPVKNVIVLIPDGCSVAVQTMARWYKGAPLAIDTHRMWSGGVQTFMADSLITDSASAGTAFACGIKSSDGVLGLAPRHDTLLETMQHLATDDLDELEPVASVLEAAKGKGKSVGLVATSRITHATPAAFAAHIHTRNDDNGIMEQMVYQNIDVAFGGGKRHLLPTSVPGGKRTDGENLLEVLLARGYQWAETADQMQALTSGKAWGLFSMSHMAPHIDRNPSIEPSLAEMTAKAIELLSKNKKGFFLMVEASQVDWGAHNNDPIWAITDFLAFDDAVQVAVEFAKKDKQTAVIAFPDHNTGGMSLGNWQTDSSYTKTKVQGLVAPLLGMTCTANAAVAAAGLNPESYVLPPEKEADLKQAVLAKWNIALTDDVTNPNDDMDQIRAFVPYAGVSYALANVVSRNHTIIGWTTFGHTGEDVMLWTFGPDSLAGLVDNTEIATQIAKYFGAKLDSVSRLLFQDVTKFASVDKTDPANPVVKLGKALLPVNKNILIDKQGVVRELPGLTIYNEPTGSYLPPGYTPRIYVPAVAMRYIR